jgi:hypothetical protein
MNESMAMAPGSASQPKQRKIDYSGQNPVPLKQVATLTNYLILNTAQFLNS